MNELSKEELMDVNGGYSWEEFKEDVGEAVASWGKYLAWCNAHGATPIR